MYYIHKDHLGSIDKVTNSLDVAKQSSSFDAWGRRRNPTNWTYSNIPATIFSRGYTGHEHLDKFGLINMNGRVYNPVLGRFHNPDPIVTGGSTQSWNRYSYVLNNPLKYSDPSGYMPDSEWYRRLMDWKPPHTDGGGMKPGGDGGKFNFDSGNDYQLPAYSDWRNTSDWVNNPNGTNSNGTNNYDWYSAFCKAVAKGFPNSIFSFMRQWNKQTSNSSFNGKLELVYINKQINSEENSEVKAIRGYMSIDLNAAGGGGMIESSFGANAINGGATLIDGTVLIDNLNPSKILPRSSFDNVKASAAAGKLIAKGNTLLTWTAVTADGIDIYNNRAIATNADYAKWGTDIGLAAAGTGLLAVATFIPGVNVVAWGAALFVISTLNTYDAFDPLYRQLNK